MEKRKTFSAAFILRASKGSKEEALIYCRITVDAQRVEFSIKKKVRTAIWDNGKAKANNEEGRGANEYLKQVESDIFRHYREMLTGRRMITSESLKNAYLGLAATEISLMELVEYHNTIMTDTLAWGTMKITTLPKNTLCFF
jgi:integrase/recombinase XerD